MRFEKSDRSEKKVRSQIVPFENNTSFQPFFNKGRGRSIMVSAFIVMHSSAQVFELNEDEWREACAHHPELLTEDPILAYYPRSANAFIEPKKDTYFDNEIIIRQFERLFILLKFKHEFKDHDIEIIVDNARTHSAKQYDVNHFNKKAGTKCIHETIEWIDEYGFFLTQYDKTNF
jgi:hypothetical protein